MFPGVKIIIIYQKYLYKIKKKKNILAHGKNKLYAFKPDFTNLQFFDTIIGNILDY